MRIGIYDEAQTLYGPIDKTMIVLKQLHVQELRLNLYWGARYGVASRRPARPTDPADPAYDWSLYDRTVRYANQYGIHVLFSIYGTPSWANGGLGPNHVPKNPVDLRNFALAAAKRYGGQFPDGQGGSCRRCASGSRGTSRTIRCSSPRSTTARRSRAPIDYTKICNAVYTGVHATLYRERARRLRRHGARAATTTRRARGRPSRRSPSCARVKKAGLKKFDAWAHHPYYAGPSDTPTTKPTGARGGPPTAVTLGNLTDLTRLLTQLYGNKRLWITEYGYQTNPPDRLVGVSWAKQAAYLTQAFAIGAEEPAHRHDALVPAQGRADALRLAVGPRDGDGQEEAGVRRLPAALAG